MKKSLLIAFLCIIALLITISVFIVLNFLKKDYEIRIVKVEGPDTIHLFTNTFHDFFSFISTVDEDKYPIALAMGDNELIVLKWEELDLSSCFYYKQTMGSNLTFTPDDKGVLLNGELVILVLDEGEQHGWKWLQDASPRQIKKLHSIVLSGKLTNEQLVLIQKAFKTNRHLGLQIDNENNLLDQLYALINPEWIVLASPLSHEEVSLISHFSQSKLMYLEVEDIESLEFLTAFPHLETLILYGWDDEIHGNVPSGIKRIKRLHLIDSYDVSSIPDFAESTKLEELSLSFEPEGPDNKVMFEGLKQYSNLYSLALFHNNPDISLPPLESLRKCKRLLYGEINSENDLENLTNIFPDLEILGFVPGENLTGLDPLKELKQLKALTIYDINTDNMAAYLDTLMELKNLQLLVLPESEFEEDNKARIKELQKALPDTFLVPVGICLGSRWILALLLAPLIVFIYSLVLHNKRNYGRLKNTKT